MPESTDVTLESRVVAIEKWIQRYESGKPGRKSISDETKAAVRADSERMMGRELALKYELSYATITKILKGKI
jgi:hypothetical protein